MKIKTLIFLTVILVVCSFGAASAQDYSMTLDHVVGGLEGDRLNIDTDVQFHMRISANAYPNCHLNPSFALQVYSEDGAQWGGLTMTYLGVREDTIYYVPDVILITDTISFDELFTQYFSEGRSIDGMGADSIGFAGLTMGSDPAIYYGLDTSVLYLQIHPTAASHGTNICLDIAPNMSGYEWAWPAVGLVGEDPCELTEDVIPYWGGPYCFEVWDTTQVAASNLVLSDDTLYFNTVEGAGNPANQTIGVDSDLDPLAFTLAESADWLTLDPMSGTTPQTITVSVDNATLTQGTYLHEVTVTAAEADNSPQMFYVQVDVAQAPPVISCPAEAFNETICGAGQVCVPLAITGAETVTADGATWADGQLCFDVTSSDAYVFEVTATNASGSDNCTVTVNVTVGEAPVITCPELPADVFLCGAGEVCVPLEIVGAEGVTVEGATWADGQLCFQAATTQQYVFDVAATNSCGTDNCQVTVNVEIGEGAVITCPAEPIDIFLCDPGQVCIDLPITGATSVAVDGATWDADQLCFDATMADTYNFHVVATNDCGDVTCDVTVNVTMGEDVMITCPGETINIEIQEPGQVCVDLPIMNADDVFVDGATWADDVLCFDATDSMVYNFTVTAQNACDTAVCQLAVDVAIVPPCVDIVLSADFFSFTYIQGTELFAPLSETMNVSSSDGETNFEFSVMAPIEVDWISFEPPTATTPADVEILVSPEALEVGLHQAICVVNTSDWQVCAPQLMQFTVQIEVFPAPSADTVVVATAPAVPGMQVSVPVTFTNSCFLHGATAVLGWDSPDLHLDSVSLADSHIGDFEFTLTVDNDMMWAAMTGTYGDGGPFTPTSGANWANLHFTVSCEATAGMHNIFVAEGVIYTPALLFDRDCGDGMESETPEFIGGGVMVDTSANYICGWVVEDNGMGGYMEVEGATVQLWADFPFDAPMDETTSGHIGSFAFADFTQIPFDLYAYKEGYYPGIVENLNFGDKGVMIVLERVAELTPTDMWVDYYCEFNTLLDMPMPVGFVIEAYANGILCGRQMIDIPGRYQFMPVYRDSVETAEIEGAATGDILTFFVNGEEAMATGDVIYPATYAQVEVCLEAGAVITKTCELVEGWNLVSWNVNTESDDIVDVLGPYMDCIDVVLGFEQGGLTYDPDLVQFSTLDWVDHQSGYWIRVKEGCSVTLELEGLPVLANMPIPVTAGWNLVSYLPDYAMVPEEALATVDAMLLVAYGFDAGAKVYKPDNAAFNTLDEMMSCYGYWLKVEADGELVYPGAGPAVAAARFNPNALAAAKLAPTDVTPTTRWVNLYSSDLTLDGEIVQAGATIAAVTSEGRKVGGFTMTEDGTFGFMPVYADDASGEKIAGLKEGETFHLQVNGIDTDEEFTWTNAGDRQEVTSLSTGSNAGDNLPTTYSLAQNYPNPFNPGTSIPFYMPAAGKAKVEVFNVLGKLVAVPYDDVAGAGETVVEWNGKNANGEEVSSGVYFYRLTTDSFSATKKMMLLK